MTEKLSTDQRIVDNLPRIALVVTDGKNTGTLAGLKRAVAYADSRNLMILTVGVGKFVSKSELQIISKRINEHIIQSPTFEGLLNEGLDETVEKLCMCE